MDEGRVRIKSTIQSLKMVGGIGEGRSPKTGITRTAQAMVVIQEQMAMGKIMEVMKMMTMMMQMMMMRMMMKMMRMKETMMRMKRRKKKVKMRMMMMTFH